MMQRLKKRGLQLLSEGKPLAEAALLVGKDPATLWRWRKADPEFDQAVAKLNDENDAIRTVMVEDSMFQRIISGCAHPAETIFWLKNRAPDRWKDKVSGEFLDEKGKPQKIGLAVLQQVMVRVEQARAAADQ